MRLFTLYCAAAPGVSRLHYFVYFRKRNSSQTIYLSIFLTDFENKYFLLQALFLSLGENYSKTELTFQSAIASAIEHRFWHEAGLGGELYGVFLLENKKRDKALEQLSIARDRYKQWGAMKKYNEVEEYIERISLSTIGI